MSTILQPCFESQFIETATVKLKVAPSSSSSPPPPTSSSTSTDLCGLSFQHVLAGICSGGTSPVVEKESVYVHPLSKRSSSSSSSRLSEKSFEMCTENLGSETGTDDIMDSSILSSLYSSSPFSSPSPSLREYSSSSKKNCKAHSSSRNFPPPLTTISGANSLQVRPHREDGRLVLRAIETPVRHTYLQAERSNGRLRLTLYKHHHATHDSTENDEIEIDNEGEEEQEEEEEEEEEENESSYMNDQDLEEINDQEDDDDDESDAEIVIYNNDMDPNDYDIHEPHEMGMEKYQRLSRRCNEGGHTTTVLYKPLWVATS